ncbi:hypothetical protein PYCC9005_001995 [Savitreella phatthalungensis]
MDSSRFTDAGSEEFRVVSEKVLAMCEQEKATSQRWYHVGAPEYRRRREAGLTNWPAKKVLPQAYNVEIPSRDPHRSITVRVLRPPSTAQPKGIYIHIHGGGWVLGSADAHDGLLLDIATATGFLVATVEYRLAPEHASPAAEHDCFDAAVYMASESALAVFEVDQDAQRNLFVGGESAGGHLAALTALHLRDTGKPDVLKGAVLTYGVFDLSFTPSVRACKVPLVLEYTDMLKFRQAYLPDKSTDDEFKHPQISPLYADLKNLPPALFQCGTRDLLLDDTLFMHARWLAAGNRAKIDIVSGGFHGYATSSLPVQGPLYVGTVADFIKEHTAAR